MRRGPRLRRSYFGEGGPTSLILEPMRDIIWMTLNCFWNPKITAKYLAADGVSTLTKDAEIIMSPLGWTAIVDLTDVSSGTGGWDWMYPTHKELDPSLAYSKGKVAFISPLNPIVTDGLTDLVSSAVVMAGPGTWLCVKDCPSATWDDPLDYSSGTFNVPQIPYPGATGTPSGTPLKGDIDGDNVYWVLVTAICP